MPCNFKAELTKAINSNQTLQSIHQKYLIASARIILKMDRSKHKYNSKAYLNEYLGLAKPLITDFTLAEKLLLATMELDHLQLQSILADCQDINYILAAIMDKRYLSY